MTFNPKKIYTSSTPGQTGSSGQDLANNFNENFESVKNELEEKDRKIVQLEQESTEASATSNSLYDWSNRVYRNRIYSITDGIVKGELIAWSQSAIIGIQQNSNFDRTVFIPVKPNTYYKIKGFTASSTRLGVGFFKEALASALCTNKGITPISKISIDSHSYVFGDVAEFLTSPDCNFIVINSRENNTYYPIEVFEGENYTNGTGASKLITYKNIVDILSSKVFYGSSRLVYKSNNGNIVQGRYIANTSSGVTEISTLADWAKTIPIKVTPNSRLFIDFGGSNELYRSLNAAFSIEKNDLIIGGFSSSVEFYNASTRYNPMLGYAVIDTPSNANYLHLNIKTSSMAKPAKITVSEIFSTSATQIRESLLPESVLLDRDFYEVDYKKDFSNGTIVYTATNLNTIAGKYIKNTSSGVSGIDNLNGCIISAPIPVVGGKYYKIEGLSSPIGKNVLFSNTNQSDILEGVFFTQKHQLDRAQIEFNAINDYFKTPINCNYLQFTIQFKNSSYHDEQDAVLANIKLVQWDEKTYNNDYYITKSPKTITKYNLSGLTWATIGDSISWLNDNLSGYPITHGYQTSVQEEIMFKEVYNYGYSGHTLTEIAGRTRTFSYSATWKTADIYTLFIGVNDINAGIVIGTTSDFINKTGWGTAYGAYREVLDYIYARNPKAYVFFAKTHKHRNATAEQIPKFAEYFQCIDWVCANYSIPIIDVHGEAGFNTYTHTSVCYDHVHPTDFGFDKIAALFIAAFKKSIIPQ